MYKISVPMMNSSVTAETRNTYLKQIQDAGVQRVFLALADLFKSEDEESRTLASIRENVEFFERNNIEACVWMETTLGHGGVFALNYADHSKRLFPENTERVNLNGEVLDNTCCPLHDSVRQIIARQVASVAKSGARIILLDDDFRMSMGSRASHCCVCDLHMKRMMELTGEELSLEKIEDLVFHSPSNKYRKAWLQAQGEGLRMLAEDIRSAVDNVDPTVRIAMCSTPAVW